MDEVKQPDALHLADLIERYNSGVHSQAIVEDYCKASAELRRLHALNLEWQQKAATWLASPAAAQRLDGYQELAQRLNAAEQRSDELLRALKACLVKGVRWHPCDPVVIQASYAIAKAEGEKK